MTMMFRSALAAALAATCAVGQADRFLPEKPMFRIEMNGVSKLAEKFAGTNLGSMLASEEMDEIWKTVVSSLGEEMESDTPPEVMSLLEGMKSSLEDYAGRMTIGGRISMDEETQEPSLIVVLTMSPSEGTDLSEVATMINEKISERDDAEIVEKNIADGSPVDVVAMDDGLSMMMPKVIDGHFVMAAGHLGDFISKLGERESAETDADRADVHIELNRELWSQLPAMMRSAEDFEVQMAAMAMGPVFDLLESLDKIDMAIAPSGQFVEMITELAFDASQPNIGELLAPSENQSVGLIDLAPRSGANSGTFSLNIDKFLEIVDGIAQGFGESLEDAEDQFEDQTGLRLRADLLDHIDGSMLVVSKGNAMDEESIGYTIAFGIKNTEALEKSVESLLEDQGFMSLRKKEEYRGITVSKINFFGAVDISWAFTDGALVFGFSPGEAGAGVRELLDASADRKSGKDPEKWPDPVRARLAKAGQGYQWLSVTDESENVEELAEGLQVLAEDEGAPEELADAVVSWIRLMGRFDLLTYVSTTKFERGRILARSIW